jgi:hypothetical protein
LLGFGSGRCCKSLDSVELIVSSLAIPTVSGDRSAIPWSEIQTEWRDREHRASRQAISEVEGLVIDDVDSLLFATGSPSQKSADDILERAFAAAADAPDGEVLLAMYLYGRCLEKWEQTEDYARIRIVLVALKNLAGTLRPDGSSANGRAQLFSVIVGQAQVMTNAMRVEDALSCSCPVAMGTRARDVVKRLDALLEQERALDDDLHDLREVLRNDAATSRRYYDTIAAVADAVCAFVTQEAPGPTDFDLALNALSIALQGDVYESELRAHYASLKALRDCAEKPRLRIDDAEVVYVYPFALKGVDGEEAVERALDGRVTEALHKLGLGAPKARKLELNDLWEPRDALESGYSGVSIELPRIAVTTTALDEFEVDAEVRLSRLGNHHLRVRCRLQDAGVHEVNQALRRGTHAMGEETLKSGTRTWTKFPHYAYDVIRAIAAKLGEKQVGNLNATSHVVLAARSISVQHRDGRTSPAKLAEVEEAVGATLLFHPVRHLATSLEEWIRYPRPSVKNLLGQQGYAGDLVARTDNTTVTFMPASPEWLVDEYEEMIEFVASIPPLLTQWEDQAWRLAKELDKIEQTHKQDISMESLREKATRALVLEQDIRGQLAFLRSPALCRTLAQRQFLDQLWKAAGLPALESELERRLTRLTERQGRIAALVRREEQKHAERFADRIQILLGLLAVASLTGVALWINDAFDVHRGAWAWGETAGLAGAGLFVVVVIAWARR